MSAYGYEDKLECIVKYLVLLGKTEAFVLCISLLTS